ncbi:hypothetical protein FOZ61_006382 [Perkinsus olseni]|uniref:Uncharacterized protein n=1 Tax=Perkinsus olseni TaxID=32597 RepID=A0A7J6LDG1_PEROL|nr:hypothetical protein FOZ61_006382 [Perkinsus olseni]
MNLRGRYAKRGFEAHRAYRGGESKVAGATLSSIPTQNFGISQVKNIRMIHPHPPRSQQSTVAILMQLYSPLVIG